MIANVTSASPGTYTNTIPVNGLQTSFGNNPVAATAVLTVSATTPVVPQVTKAFSPNTNGPGGISTLTITVANANATAATLTAALVDSLPAGVVLAPSPNASTTCGGGVVTAVAGGSSITLSTGSTIPAGCTCMVIANVTSATPGTYTNTIPVNGLQTSFGNNPVAATAVLTISAVISPVPTLTEWAMIGLAGLVPGAFLAIRRRRMTN